MKWHQRPVRMMRLDYVDALARVKDADLDALARSTHDEWHVNCEWVIGTPGIAPGLGYLTTFNTTKFDKVSSLGDFDLIREYLPYARKYGINVVAYLNMHWFAYDFADAHPGWEQVTADGVSYGKINPLYGDGTTLCVNSGWREWAFELVREVIATGIDGVFLDGPVIFPGCCYCDSCRERFKSDYGADLPLVEDWSNPDWISFVQFRTQSLVQFLSDSRDAAKSVNPESVVFLNAGSWQANSWRFARSLDMVGPYEDFNGAEAFFHPGPHDQMLFPWAATGKYMVAGGKPAIVFSHHALGGWHYLPLSKIEAELAVAQTVACGANPWIAVFDYALDHSRDEAIEPINNIQGFLAKNEDYYINSTSCADIALLNSSQTGTYYVSKHKEFYGSVGSGKEENLLVEMSGKSESVDWASRKETCEETINNSYLGYFLSLTRSHIPFDVLLDNDISSEALSRYKVLILPNSACLSDTQIESIQAFVRQGGSVVAEFETGCYNEIGRVRDLNPLFQTFGASEVVRMMKPISYEEYVRIKQTHPVFGEFKENRLLARPTYSLESKAASDAFVPSVFMNEAGGSYCPLKGESTIPALIVNSTEAGRTVYIPSLVGDFYGRFKLPDYEKLIESILLWAHVDPLSITVDCPPTVQVEMRRNYNGEKLIIHLVNNTGDMQRPITEIIPLQNVRIRLRSNAVKKVRAIRSEIDLSFNYQDNQVEFVLPELGLYELIVVDL